MRAVPRSLLLLAGVILMPGAAPAHDALSGWHYDAWCCGGRDCQEIAQDQVRITPDGYLVTIPQGSHATAREDHSKLFRYDEVQRSGDERYHACIVPHTQDFRCLYVPAFTY